MMRMSGSKAPDRRTGCRWKKQSMAGGLAVLLCLALAAALPATAQTAHARRGVYAPVKEFDPDRDAAKDISNAVAEARRSHRRVLLDVGGNWCIWCRRLDSLFVQHPDIATYMHRKYVVVKVNWSTENKNERVLSRYPKIPGYPHYFVLDTYGTLLRSQDTGELESGNHHSPEKVLAFLKQWAPQ